MMSAPARDLAFADLGLATMTCARAPANMSSNMSSLRPTVLIVDDHADFRASAREMLEAEGFDVVGEAADGEQALAEVERLTPDVVLLDVQLPGEDGFTVAKRLSTGGSSATVILISSREAAAYGQRVESAAARGFIAKRDLSGEALAALLL